MKLFWREHVPLAFMYAGQLLLTITVCRLAGFKDYSALAYIALLSVSLFAFYLLYRYGMHAKLYRMLARPPKTLDESIVQLGAAPLAEALEQLMQSQYRHYQNDIGRYRKKLDDQLTFIHQWVHQMKTPLSVVHLAIQEENDPVFDSIREELDRMKKGLETVLYTARLEAFEQDFVVQPVRLHQLVGKVVSEHKNLFIRSSVFPELQVDDQLIVMSDDKWLAFAIGQLVTNAVRYSAGRGHRVTFGASIRGNRTCLEVRDYGIGIPQQDIRRVFDPYFTGENGRRYGESTGMGLYLVREICARLDHRVELESEPGQGTAVRIWMRTAISAAT
ncbi:sensor histidine kinase [Paenibacillus allorhizosphaerae]|uniref:histidine kinase n=1 Tax=Paenibacillus allorhizosphaerae TaxID=2849866 RepID=A0ABN7TE07_9BACL|nr:sensor histidine kinase [Paenibacillus allorhizosphaerae]CAG7626863.1 Sensor histidine kinase GraS [Paenibacillus allorhizosphaerae]